MIEVLLDAIHNAEVTAEKIIADANLKAQKIEENARIEIEKIESQTADKAAKFTLADLFTADEIGTPAQLTATAIAPQAPDPKRITEAKNYIKKQFAARYTK